MTSQGRRPEPENWREPENVEIIEDHRYTPRINNNKDRESEKVSDDLRLFSRVRFIYRRKINVNRKTSMFEHGYWRKFSLLYLLSKFKEIVAFDSPSSFFAVTLYLPASSTVTFFISSVAKYEWPSLSTVSWNFKVGK